MTEQASQNDTTILAKAGWKTLLGCGIASALLHILLFFCVGWYLDSRSASIEFEVNWSQEALTGFGMGIFAPLAEHSYPDEEPDDAVEENPFSKPKPAPKLAAALKKVAPPKAPEPPKPIEAASQASTNQNDSAADTQESQDIAQEYSLANDAEGLQRVRSDMQSMPDLKGMAPGNAKLIVLIRTPRLKGTRFEASVRRLLKAFPDYQVTLGLSDIDPIDNIHAFLMATNNPELFANTFLAVSHSIEPAVLRAAIDASFPTPLRWEDYNGLPLGVPDQDRGPYPAGSGIYQRSLYLPYDNLVLYLRPEAIPTLGNQVVVPPNPSDIVDPDVPPQAPKTFLETLTLVPEADTETKPAMLLRIQDIASLNFGPSFPDFSPPQAIDATLSADDDPRIHLALSFANHEEASHFFEIWPELLEASASFRVPGLAGILSGLYPAVEDSQVLIAGQINGTTLGIILLFAANSLPKVRE